jgi:hypothetical protein
VRFYRPEEVALVRGLVGRLRQGRAA